MEHENEERRKERRLSEEEIEAIAIRVKKLALDEIYADIGKGVVRRLLWLLGISGSALAGYLYSKGFK